MGDEAEAMVQHYSGGWAGEPRFDEPDDVYDGSGTALDEKPTAASAALSLTGRVQEVLKEVEHLPCSYAEYASLTTDTDGKLAVLCGCGYIAPAGDLIEGSRTMTPAEVEVHQGTKITVHGADPIARTAELIQPGAHYTPEMLETNILDVLGRLETGGAFERLCIEQQAQAETAYTIAYARAFNNQTGPVEVRTQGAIAECVEALEARDEARMIAKAVKASMHNLRSVLSGYQSVNASVRETYRNANMQQRG